MGVGALQAEEADFHAQAQQTTTLRVFSGGQNQRPDLMRQLLDQYQKANPNVKIIKAIGLVFDKMRKERGITISK